MQYPSARPARLTAGRAVGEGFGLVFGNFGTVASVTLLLIGLVGVLSGFYSASFIESFTASMNAWAESLMYGGVELPRLPGIAPLFLLSWLAGIVLTPLCYGALIIVFSRAHIGKATDFSLAMRFSIARTGRLIVLNLCWTLLGLAVSIALMAVIFVLAIPMGLIGGFLGATGVVLIVLFGLALLAGAAIVGAGYQMAYMMSYAVAMNENIWVFRAVMRGFKLALKRFWSYFGASLIIALCAMAATLIVTTATSLAVLESTGGLVFSAAVSSMVSCLITSLSLAVCSQYYFSVRAEFEGWQHMTAGEASVPEAAREAAAAPAEAEATTTESGPAATNDASSEELPPDNG